MNHHNQRQKKRSSQSKKRYHESAKKEGTASKPPPSSQKQKTSPPVKSEANPSGTHVLESSKSKSGQAQVHETEKKSFGRRKVTSNWSRYDEGDMVANPDGPTGTDSSGYLRTSETEEELQLRLIQLLNLPVLTNTSVEAAELTQDYSVLGSQVNSQFITLDCCALADSLSRLPVHERLDIDTGLLELGGYTDEYSSKQETFTEELSSVTLREDTKLTNVEDTCDRLQDLAVIPGKHKGEGFKFQFSTQSSQAAAGRVPEAKHPQPSGINETVNTDLGGDTELDHLLQQPNTTIKFGNEENKHDVIGNEQQGHPSAAPPKPAHDVDELDDMLDELLLA